MSDTLEPAGCSRRESSAILWTAIAAVSWVFVRHSLEDPAVTLAVDALD